MMKGEEYALKIYDIEVENYHFQSDKSGNDVVIKIGHKDIFIEGKQTYIIKYKVKGALLFEDNFTEFQWNVTGTNWPVAIESAGFGVYFDGNLNLTKDDYFVNAGRAGTSDAFATAKFLQNKIIGNAEKSLNQVKE